MWDIEAAVAVGYINYLQWGNLPANFLATCPYNHTFISLILALKMESVSFYSLLYPTPRKYYSRLNKVLTCLLSPSSAANWFAASQEIPRTSRNPKVHHRTHKRPPPVSILGQPNPVNIHTSQLLEIHPNINHTSTPRSPQWSPSLRFPHQDPIHCPLLTHTRHMPSPSHSS